MFWSFLCVRNWMTRRVEHLILVIEVSGSVQHLSDVDEVIHWLDKSSGIFYILSLWFLKALIWISFEKCLNICWQLWMSFIHLIKYLDTFSISIWSNFRMKFLNLLFVLYYETSFLYNVRVAAKNAKQKRHNWYWQQPWVLSCQLDF